jgi:tyrosine-protein phosphatase YwqE
MFSCFRKRQPVPVLEPFTTDIHSHLLPGLDDGAATEEESLTMIQGFADRGYRRLYTTPHILADFYPNTPETILPALAQMQAAIKEKGIDIELFAAAEYYLDDAFIEALAQNKPLLHFGKQKYVLFETAFINEPVYLRQVIFDLFSNGYTPVLAHPERYQYFFDAPAVVDQIFDTGVLFQVNYLSLVNYYAPPVTKLAEYLIDQGKVHFLGSDCHKPRHLEAMKALEKNKHWRKALNLPLLNRDI